MKPLDYLVALFIYNFTASPTLPVILRNKKLILKSKTMSDSDQGDHIEGQAQAEAQELEPPTWKPSLRPEFRVRVPVPRAPTFMVARTEILDFEPLIKQDALDKYYNMFTQDDIIVVSPTDKLDKLYSIFQSVILPEVEAYVSGHMTHADFSSFIGDGYIRGIVNDFLKATRVLEDPALFGCTYAGGEGRERFNCTWRNYTELDKYFVISFIIY